MMTDGERLEARVTRLERRVAGLRRANSVAWATVVGVVVAMACRDRQGAEATAAGAGEKAGAAPVREIVLASEDGARQLKLNPDGVWLSKKGAANTASLTVDSPQLSVGADGAVLQPHQALFQHPSGNTALLRADELGGRASFKEKKSGVEMDVGAEQGRSAIDMAAPQVGEKVPPTLALSMDKDGTSHLKMEDTGREGGVWISSNRTGTGVIVTLGLAEKRLWLEPKKK